jgi:hypothetical protein
MQRSWHAKYNFENDGSFALSEVDSRPLPFRGQGMKAEMLNSLFQSPWKLLGTRDFFCSHVDVRRVRLEVHVTSLEDSSFPLAPVTR